MIGRALTLAGLVVIARLIDQLRLDIRRLTLRVIRLEAITDQLRVTSSTPWWLKDHHR